MIQWKPLWSIPEVFNVSEVAEKTEYEVEDGVILDGDTRIEVVNDTPEADQNRTPLKDIPAEVTDEELTKYSDQKLKDRLAHLGKGYHEERRAKEAALREREEAIRVTQAVVAENQKLQGSLATNQNALLDQAKRVVQGEIDDAKRKMRAAQEAFDTDAIVEAQELLTAAKIKADRVNNFRAPTVQAQQPVVQTPQQPQPVTLDAKTQAWQSENQWFGQNRKMTAYALSLHEDLVEQGFKTGSDAYYERINADVKNRFPEAFDGESADAKTSQRARSNVAPASRSTASKKVVLTQTQVNLAKRLGLPLDVYARSVAELNRN
jgi:hypothetical protein